MQSEFAADTQYLIPQDVRMCESEGWRSSYYLVVHVKYTSLMIFYVK